MAGRVRRRSRQGAAVRDLREASMIRLQGGKSSAVSSATMVADGGRGRGWETLAVFRKSLKR